LIEHGVANIFNKHFFEFVEIGWFPKKIANHPIIPSHRKGDLEELRGVFRRFHCCNSGRQTWRSLAHEEWVKFGGLLMVQKSQGQPAERRPNGCFSGICWGGEKNCPVKYGDYFINHDIRIPIKQPGFYGK